MKQKLRELLRQFHLAVLKRPLPQRAAIYLHNVKPAQHAGLREALGFFRDQGYAFAGPADLCAEGSGKRLLVSFDDNFRDWNHMLPVLSDLDVTATFYINTLPLRDRADSDDAADYFRRISEAGEEALSSAEVREIAVAGHKIGCHTHSHAFLNEIDQALYSSEIDRSKRILEEVLGREVTDFAFPYGKRRHFNRALRDHCTGLGFKTIANAIPGRQHARQRPLWINRSPWHLDAPLDFNLDNLRIDGRMFERLTGRRVGF